MDRMRRVNELIKRELGTIFERLICPQVEGLVTITEVRTNPDLRQSHVFVSTLGVKDGGLAAFRLILEQRKEMQRLLAKNVKLKYTPKLDFKLDSTPESADKVTQLLAELEKGFEHDHD